MEWILEFIGALARWGSLTLLAWGAALCLHETLRRDDPIALRAAGGTVHSHDG